MGTIYRISVNEGAATSVIAGMHPDWSSAGIVYRDGNNLYTIVPGGTETLLYTDPDGNTLSYPAWSPDNSMVSFSYSGIGGEDCLDVIGAAEGVLIEGHMPNTIARSLWTPDGGRVIYQDLDIADMEIYSVKYDDLNDRVRLTNNSYEDMLYFVAED